MSGRAAAARGEGAAGGPEVRLHEDVHHSSPRTILQLRLLLTDLLGHHRDQWLHHVRGSEREADRGGGFY